MKHGEVILELCDFSLRYPFAPQPALSNLSLTVRAGERILLLGPSGSGKSSLAYAASGLIPEHVACERSGHILLGGKDPATLTPPERANLAAIVFQDPETQFCTLSVEDEIAFGLENQGVSSADIERKIEQVTDRLGIAELRKQRLDRLSGGQKQLVAFACSLVLEPCLLILDEITAHLDSINSSLVYDCVRELLETDRDTAVVVIEHRLDEVKHLIRRLVVLQRNGSLLIDGECEMVFCEQRELLKKHGVWVPGVTYADLRTECSQETKRGEQPPLVCRGLSFAYVGVSRHLKSSFNRPGLLRSLSFALFSGEILAIFGPNGSGKTTLLWLLAGLLEPVAGDVLLAGKNPARLPGPQISRLCGVVFQNPEHHFVTDTVFDEVALSIRWETKDARKTRHRTERLLEQVDLAWAAQMNPFDLSWGEKRRLSVAAALACGCRVLLLDEPTFGQDLAGTYALARLLLQLRHEGVAVLLVTHDRTLARAIGDRTLELTDGLLRKCNDSVAGWTK